VSAICQIPHCGDFQRVLVADPGGDALRVCVEHWRDALQDSSGQICGISLIDCPTCAHAGCLNDAKANVPDVAGGDRPMCRKHLDGMSWVLLPFASTSDTRGARG
jgi:hypothetical protein